MIQVICAVRDAKTELFARPFFVVKAGQAIRSFTDEVNRKEENNGMYHHPEDYSLYEIGIYDDDEGKIVGHTLPKLLVHAEQVKNPEQSAAHISRV